MILLPTFSISLLVARQITVCTTESVLIKTADKSVPCADAEQFSLYAQPFFIVCHTCNSLQKPVKPVWQL